MIAIPSHSNVPKFSCIIDTDGLEGRCVLRRVTNFP